MRMLPPPDFGGITVGGKSLKPSRSGHYWVPAEHIAVARSHGLVPDPELPAAAEE